MRRLRICFVADVYPVLHPELGVTFGGAEVQVLQLARTLACLAPGPLLEISFVVADHGQREVEEAEGFEFHRSYRPDEGVRGLRLIHPRASRLGFAMTRARADVYYQRCAGTATGLVALGCLLHRRPFVFAVANDRDVDLSFEADHGPAHRALYRLGLARASRIVVQTGHQARLLAANHGRRGALVRSVCPVRASGPRRPSGAPVLWVGALDSAKKRPELLLSLARSLPGRTFRVVGGGEPDAVRSFREKMHGLANVEFVGPVAWERVLEFYRESDLVVTTSAHEGFSNVLLEGWSCGVPSVSLEHDPDGTIERFGLGARSGSVPAMREDIERLLGSPDRYERASAAAIDYVRRHHAPEAAAEAYRRIFLAVANRRGTRHVS
ncbi:MAG: glycosyltransferase family 4 protein [Planctomycetes bacterium]|nr:glycosyltransferase family 4 protein [Planctomycetota bacterium]